jgi:hypothetical protein
VGAVNTNIWASPLSAKYRFPLLNAKPRMPVEPFTGTPPPALVQSRSRN